MIQSCSKSKILPLKFLLKTIFEEGTFPEYWKKSNVVPVHRTESKDLIKTIDLSVFFPNLVKFFYETTYKYKIRIILTSNLDHGWKEIALSLERPEFPAEAGRVATLFDS